MRKVKRSLQASKPVTKPLTEQHKEAVEKTAWWLRYETYVCAGVLAVLGLIGWGLIQLVIIPLASIPGIQTSVKVLEPVPERIASLDTEIRKDFAKLDERIDGLAVDVGVLKTLPGRIDEVARQVNESRSTITQSSKQAKDAADRMTESSKKLSEIETSLAVASTKIDQVATASVTTQQAIAKLGVPRNAERLTSTTIRVDLERPMDGGAVGVFQRTTFSVSTKGLPLLNDETRLAKCSLTGVEIKSGGGVDTSRITVEPRLAKDEYQLILTLWHNKDEKLDSARLYALVTVSWPERP